MNDVTSLNGKCWKLCILNIESGFRKESRLVIIIVAVFKLFMILGHYHTNASKKYQNQIYFQKFE